MRIINKIKKTINRLESSDAPFIYFVLTFFFAITLRNFMEIFSDHPHLFLNMFYHYYVSYICLALALIILFYFATKEKIEKIARLVLPAFLITSIVPILDLILSLGKGYDITYMLPETHGNLWLRFFTFFGDFPGKGVTPGMRIEIGLILLGSFIYFFIKNCGVLKSLIFSFLTYSLIFAYGIVPFGVRALVSIFGAKFELTTLLLLKFYLLLLFVLGIWVFYLYKKKYFIEIIKDMRVLRILHYELMFLLGLVLAIKIDLSLSEPWFNQYAIFNWFFLMAAILFACLFSIITNNLADYDIDKISNKQRPSVSKAVPVEHYKGLSWACLCLAIIYSLSVNYLSSFLILLFIGNYFLYSMPPLRLKRIPFFSKLLISLNSLVLLILGYYFVARNLNIPVGIAVFFLVCLTAAINFIDLKDYEGDKGAGIKTIPTLLGLKKSKLIIGSFFLISYIAAYFLLKNIYLLAPLIILGGVQFWLINRENYSEKPIFVVYLLSSSFLIIYLLKY